MQVKQFFCAGVALATVAGAVHAQGDTTAGTVSAELAPVLVPAATEILAEISAEPVPSAVPTTAVPVTPVPVTPVVTPAVPADPAVVVPTTPVTPAVPVTPVAPPVVAPVTTPPATPVVPVKPVVTTPVIPATPATPAVPAAPTVTPPVATPPVATPPVVAPPAVTPVRPAVPTVPAAPAVPVFTSGFNTILDGRAGEQYAGPGTRDAIMHRKPYAPDDRNLTIDSLKIQNVTNQKALDIVAARLPDGTYRAYNNITVKNYETAMVNRDGRYPGLHIDHLRIAGGGFKQDVKTDVYLENIKINGGDAVPLLIQDGMYGTVHLKNVQLNDTKLGSVQISTKGSGSIDRIIIEDSPGLSVNIMERDDTVGTVEVINSPGAKYQVAAFKTLTPDGSHFYEVDTGKVFASSANWRQIGTLDNWADSPLDGAAVGAPAWDVWEGAYGGGLDGSLGGDLSGAGSLGGENGIGESGGYWGWNGPAGVAFDLAASDYAASYASSSGGISVVPEPGLIGLVPLAALLLKRRKRA